MRLLPLSDDYVELRHKDAKLPDNTFSRLEFPITHEQLERLDDEHCRCWSDFASTLNHPSVANAFMEKFAELDLHVSLVGRTSLRLSLVRDFPGYRIRPHQDIPSKILTAQIYLPQDDRHPELGTNFYTRDETGGQERSCCTLSAKFRVRFSSIKKQLAWGRCYPSWSSDT